MKKFANPTTANLIQTIWIIFCSVVVTTYFSIVAIIIALMTKSKAKLRPRADKSLHLWSSTLLNIIHVSYTVHNRFHFEKGTQYIVMCNHTSLYDIPLSFKAVDGTLRMVAKKELARIPLLSHSMKLFEFVFINRSEREQALHDLEKAKRKMAEGVIIWICPEGTRSEGNTLLPLKTGGFMMALQTGAIIVPLGIRDAYKIHRRGSWRIMVNQHVDLVFGNPIKAANYTVETRSQLMEDVARELKIAAGIS